MIERLRRSVDEIAVIVESGEGDAEQFSRLITSTAALPGVKATVMPTGGELWRSAEQAFSRWRTTFGSLSTDDAQRLRTLEQENARLQRLLAERDLEVDALRTVLTKKC